MRETDLSLYNNKPYRPGGNVLTRMLWYYLNALVFKSALFPVNGLKVALLRVFGATVGKGVVIKPCVNIKYPWRLKIGDNTWIGEGVWIDNLVTVSIGSNVCLSQGAILQTGNHNYKKTTFDLITGNITLHNGVWIGCRAIVGPGITVGSHAVLTAGSVANKDLLPYGIYQGGPAVLIRERVIE